MDLLYNAIIGSWLWKLYRSGPMSLGFWGGLADAEVCARMAGNSEAMDWMVTTDVVSQRCLNMIERSFQSLAVSVQVLLYVCVVCVAITSLRQWVVTKLLVKSFANEFHRLQLGLMAHQPAAAAAAAVTVAAEHPD
jgi:hypothetical protein